MTDFRGILRNQMPPYQERSKDVEAAFFRDLTSKNCYHAKVLFQVTASVFSPS